MEVSRGQIDAEIAKIKSATDVTETIRALSDSLEAYKEDLITLLKAVDDRDGTKGLQSTIDNIDVRFDSSVYTAVSDITGVHNIKANEVRGKLLSEKYID